MTSDTKDFFKLNDIKEYIAQFYDTDEKHYHTIHHINRMLALHDHYQDYLYNAGVEYPAFTREDVGVEKAEDWYDGICCAIYFHDCVKLNYVEGSIKSSEELSANEATKYLKEKGVSEDRIKFVEDLILSTDNKNYNLDTVSKKYLHDLDWSCFSSMYDLKEAEDKVIQEYVDKGWLRKEVEDNRLNFYKSLYGEQVFQSVFSKYNWDAQRNIEGRINRFESISF